VGGVEQGGSMSEKKWRHQNAHPSGGCLRSQCPNQRKGGGRKGCLVVCKAKGREFNGGEGKGLSGRKNWGLGLML